MARRRVRLLSFQSVTRYQLFNAFYPAMLIRLVDQPCFD